MPIIGPGEDLKDKEKYKIPQEIIDAMNNLKKDRNKITRKKPTEKVEKSEPEKKIIGYHTICK